jgi:hypothetical protein
MSMHPENENFEELRRLLTLKRHEQPPPGYFQDFSGHVIARLRAGERTDRSGFWESLSWEAPWLQRLWGAFETKPIMAGALGMIVCGFLVSGVLLSEKADHPEVASLTGTETRGQVPVNIALQANPNSQGLDSAVGFAPEASSVLFDGMKLPSTLVSWPVAKGN